MASKKTYGIIALRNSFVLCEYLLDQWAGVRIDMAKRVECAKVHDLFFHIQKLNHPKGLCFIAFGPSFKMKDQIQLVSAIKNEGLMVEDVSSITFAYFNSSIETQEKHNRLFAFQLDDEDNLYIIEANDLGEAEVLDQTADTGPPLNEKIVYWINYLRRVATTFNKVLFVGNFKNNYHLIKAVEAVAVVPFFEPVEQVLAQTNEDFYFKILRALWNMHNRIKAKQYSLSEEKRREAIRSIEATPEKKTNYQEVELFEVELSDASLIDLLNWIKLHNNHFNEKAKDLIYAIWKAIEQAKNTPLAKLDNIYVAEVKSSFWDTMLANESKYKIEFKMYLTNNGRGRSELLEQLDEQFTQVYGQSYTIFLNENK